MIKRAISYLLCLAVLLVPATVYPMSDTEDVVYEQDFEAYLEGISLENAGMQRRDAATGIYDIIKDPVKSDNYCGRYMKKTAGEMFLVQPFPSTLTGTVTLSFSFRTTSAAYSTMQFWGETQKSTEAQVLTCTFQNFICNGSKLSREAWNEIVMKLDTESDTYEMSVNGKSSGVKSFGGTDVKNVRYARMNLTENNKEMYIDNIKITRSWKPLKTAENTNGGNSQETVKRPESGKLYVRDYGAVCDDGKSDTAAIDSALRAADKMGGDLEIIFDKGRYDMEGEGRMFNAGGLKNVKLTGNGCVLYIKSPYSSGMDFSGSENLTAEGFEIKYETAPWIQGTVESANTEDGTFTYKVMEGYDLWADPNFEWMGSEFAVPLDNDNPHMLRRDLQDFIFLNDYEKIGDRLYKVTAADPSLIQRGSIKAGDKIVCTHRLQARGTIWSVASKNLTLKDILIHESIDTVMTGVRLEGTTTVDNVSAKLDGENWVTANADGFHIQVARGPMIIRNCEIEGLLDDCVNIYQYAGMVTDRRADNEFTFYHRHGAVPKEGDTVIIYERNTGIEKGRAKIATVKNSTGTMVDAVMDKDIPGVASGEDPNTQDAYFVAELRAPGTEIKNNLFSLCRRYGILMKAADAVIEGNTFRDLGNDAINFTGGIETGDTEGAFSENVVIRNNIIDNAAYRDEARRGRSDAAITVPGYNKARVFKNITIEGNTFTNMPRVAVYAGGVDGLKINGNKFVGNAEDRVVSSGVGALYIANSANVEISGNDIMDYRRNASDQIYIDNKSDMPAMSGNSFSHDEGVNEVAVQSEILQFDFPVYKDSPKIDGDLSDWKNYHEFTVDAAESAFLFPNYTPEDLSYTGRYAWDGNNFYLGVIATDDVHSPGSLRDSSNAWQHDSIQIAFDSERIKGTGLYGHADLTVSDGGVVNRLSTVEGIPGGEVDGVDVKVVRDENAKTTTYEIAIPWGEVMPAGFKPERKKYIGVSMLMNDDDGTGRKGFLEYFSGIGKGKFPSEYANAILAETAEDADIRFEFKDTAMHWAKRYIEQMAFSGIIKGVGDGMFAPENNVTVAEFISMLLRTCDCKTHEYRGILDDVSAGDWYADGIQTAIDNGMVDGAFTEGNKIKPDSAVSRAMAAALIVRAKNLHRTKTGEYDLSGMDYRYKYYMECAIDNGIFTGYDDGSYRPDGILTRAEAAVILSKLK